MQSEAVKITIVVNLDLDTLHPSIKADFDLRSGFEFLESAPEVLANYVEHVVKTLRGESPVGIIIGSDELHG